MYNQGLIKYNCEKYCHFISIGPQGPGSSVIFEFEVSSSRRKRNVNDLADQLETLVSPLYLKHQETMNFNDIFQLISFIDEDFEGLQTVKCTEIE